MKRRGSLIIPLNFECNLRCAFCVLGERRWQMKDTSPARVLAAFKKYRRRRRSVSFTGGEPTLSPHLPMLVREAKRAGYKVSVQSNGLRYVYPEFCRELIAAGVDTYGVSFFAADERMFNALGRTKSGFREQARGIRNLVGMGQRVITNTVIHRKSAKHLVAIAKRLRSLGVGEAQFIFVRRSGPGADPSIYTFDGPSLARAMGELDRAIDVLLCAGIRPRLKLVPLCHLPRHARFIEAYLGPFRSDVLRPRVRGFDVSDLNVGENVKFWKNKTCRTCSFGSRCDGIEATSPFRPQRVEPETP